MATIKGIELASDIYDLEDTQGRTATQTAQNTANNASDKADSNETAIEAIEAVIPSTAASDNKLTTEQDLLGLCRIVTTVENVPIGTEINLQGENHPNVRWSTSITPTPPSTNAKLIAVLDPGAAWYPNIKPCVRYNNTFNLTSIDSYTLPEAINYTCVWAVPNA